MYDIIDVRTALESAVENTQPSLDGMLGLFGQSSVTNTELVELDQKFSAARVAHFVSPEAEPDGTEKEGFNRNAFKLPTIQDIRSITGKDLKDVQFGVNPYDNSNITAILSKKVAEEIANLRSMVKNAFGKMAIEVAFNGTLTVQGKGVDYQLDFGRPAELSVDVGAGDPNQYWNNAGANIKNQFLQAMQLVGKYGRTVDVVIGRISTIGLIVDNDNVKGQLDNRRYELGNVAIRSMLATEGMVYMGEYLGVTLIGFDGTYQDADGNTQQAVPADSVVFGATVSGNYVQYGESAAFLGDIVSQNGVVATRDGTNFLAAVYPSASYKDIKVYGAHCGAPLQGDMGAFTTFKVLP